MNNVDIGFEVYFDTDYSERLSGLLKKYAPYGKVAFLLTEKDFSAFYDKISDVLKKSGNKAVFITFSTPLEFSVDKICGLFNLHEDARLVVSFGTDLAPVADYFASVRKIRSVTVTEKFTDRLFNPRLFIKNGASLDCFTADCKKSVIVTGVKNVDRAEMFAFIAEKKFALFDYYARTLFTRTDFDDISANEIIKHLNAAEKLFFQNQTTEESCVQIYRNLSNAFLTDRENRGKFFANSPCAVTEQIVKKSLGFSKRLFICLKALRTVEKTISNNFQVFPPDYNQIAQTVSETLGVDCSSARKILLNQIKTFSVSSAVQVTEFKRAIVKTSEYLKDVLIKYFALGGKNKKLTPFENAALSLCGNTLFGFNVITVIRELPFIV